MDLPVVEKHVPAILLNCDNQTVIVKVNNSKYNAKGLSRNVIESASREMCLKPVDVTP